MDFAGPFLGRMYLIVTVAHSKWLEVIEMSSKTIMMLHHLFASSGLPEQLVSDNGPQMNSSGSCAPME